MPQLEEAVYARLSGFAGLSALVSARIYLDKAPQGGVFPLVVFQRISALRTSAMGVDTGVVRARIQTTSWATTPGSAKNIKEQVRYALQRWMGTAAGVVVLDSLLVDERDLYDAEAEPAGVGAPGAYGCSLDAMIAYRET